MQRPSSENAQLFAVKRSGRGLDGRAIAEAETQAQLVLPRRGGLWPAGEQLVRAAFLCFDIPGCPMSHAQEVEMSGDCMYQHAHQCMQNSCGTSALCVRCDQYATMDQAYSKLTC